MGEFDKVPYLPWPGNKDKVFTGGFLRGPSVALLDNWLRNSGCDALLSEAYKEAADMIVSYIEDGGSKYNHAGLYFFPVAYLYRHSFELCLKQLIYQGVELRILEENNALKKLLSEHRLYPLWDKVRVVLENVYPDGNQDDIKNVDRLIQEIHKLDDSGQKFRYPKDKNGKPTTVELPMTVDLSAMKKTCNNLFSFFVACEAALSELPDLRGLF
jgi:hypothetical protein